MDTALRNIDLKNLNVEFYVQQLLLHSIRMERIFISAFIIEKNGIKMIRENEKDLTYINKIFKLSLIIIKCWFFYSITLL